MISMKRLHKTDPLEIGGLTLKVQGLKDPGFYIHFEAFWRWVPEVDIKKIVGWLKLNFPKEFARSKK